MRGVPAPAYSEQSDVAMCQSQPNQSIKCASLDASACSDAAYKCVLEGCHAKAMQEAFTSIQGHSNQH